MTTENLSAITVRTIDQYNLAGKTLVASYRTGVRRLLDVAAARTSALLEQNKSQLISAEVKERLLGGQRKYYGFLVERVDADTSAAVSLMDYVATASVSGVESLASRAAKIESPVATTLLNSFETLNLPLANLSAGIADKIVEGAKQIEARVSGESKAGAKSVQDVVVKKAREAKAAVEAN